MKVFSKRFIKYYNKKTQTYPAVYLNLFSEKTKSH